MTVSASEKRMALRLPAVDAERLERLAKLNERSVSAELRVAIRAHLNQFEEKAAA